MTKRTEIEHALNRYNEAHRWLDGHTVAAASPTKRLAVHRIAAYWARQIETLRGSDSPTPLPY